MKKKGKYYQKNSLKLKNAKIVTKRGNNAFIYVAKKHYKPFFINEQD